jgi:hypothetical protein
LWDKDEFLGGFRWERERPREEEPRARLRLSEEGVQMKRCTEYRRGLNMVPGESVVSTDDEGGRRLSGGSSRVGGAKPRLVGILITDQRGFSLEGKTRN